MNCIGVASTEIMCCSLHSSFLSTTVLKVLLLLMINSSTMTSGKITIRMETNEETMVSVLVWKHPWNSHPITHSRRPITRSRRGTILIPSLRGATTILFRQGTIPIHFHPEVIPTHSLPEVIPIRSRLRTVLSRPGTTTLWIVQCDPPIGIWLIRTITMIGILPLKVWHDDNLLQKSMKRNFSCVTALHLMPLTFGRNTWMN